jgi:hypothetical protein
MNKLENLAKQLDELDDKFKLLNSSSNFLTYHILHALTAVKSQCDYEQLCQIEQT